MVVALAVCIALTVAQAGLSFAQPARVGPEFRVNEFTENLQLHPTVAHQGNGSFVVVWASYNQVSTNSDSDIIGQRFDSSGDPVGPEFFVNAFTTSAQFSPAIDTDADGRFVVVWTSEGRHDGLRVRHIRAALRLKRRGARR